MKPAKMVDRRTFVAMIGALALGCDDAHGQPAHPTGTGSRTATLASAAPEVPSRLDVIKVTRDKLRPVHVRPPKAKPGEWRAEHPEERGQTFEQYVASEPTTADGARKVICVQPLGDFKPTHRKIVKLAAEYLALHFQLETRILPDVSLAVVPKSARRKHPQWGDSQILAPYVLNKLLPPRLPKDAAALIAFTPSDLWPGGGWNFVFGQAQLRERVGVWSLYRNGNGDAGPDAFRLALLRALKIAVHETGHMFSLEHCTSYKCVQAGVNSLDESDASPLWLCPECEAKVAWATRSDSIERMRGLRDFCEIQSLTRESEFFARELNVLKSAT